MPIGITTSLRGELPSTEGAKEGDRDRLGDLVGGEDRWILGVRELRMLGSGDGLAVGLVVGRLDGLVETGAFVGRIVGLFVLRDGFKEGMIVGEDGATVGEKVGPEGAIVGIMVGEVSAMVGTDEGRFVGSLVGKVKIVGLEEG